MAAFRVIDQRWVQGNHPHDPSNRRARADAAVDPQIPAGQAAVDGDVEMEGLARNAGAGLPLSPRR